jgi:hypothetical protein
MAMNFMSLTFHEQSLLLWLSDFDQMQLRNCEPNVLSEELLVVYSRISGQLARVSLLEDEMT